MSKLLFDGIFKFIETYFNGLGSSMKNLDILFYVFVGLELLFVIYFLVKSHFAYQFRLIRAIDKINIYLLNNSYINENNLIEFNKKMKKVPKVLRYHWQQYMLYREQSPSFYMSSNNVIEKPLRSSSVKYNIKTMKALTIIFTTLSVLFSAAVLALQPSPSSIVSQFIFRILIIPSMIIFIGCVYGIYQNARQSANLSDLYQTFHIFQRLIDKAVTTMPEYVDFEVLFTKKEIAKGIPALNEYLEKRARQEQEELEKARRNAVDHEVYDFGSVDISGSLILDRAMKETEIYLSLRNRLLAEIQQVESQIDTLKKSYDNTQREIQRKMQTAKENIERIRMQQESSTNRIEGNYLKKQQDQEISKLTQLEKDNTEETYRFNQELEVLTSEIDKKKAELEERRKYIEKAMLAEYKTYSTKVFKNLLKVANEKEKEERETLAETKDSYAQQIVELKDKVQELSYENTQLKDRIKNFDSELSEKESFYTNALIETAEKAKSALVGKKGDSTTEGIEIPAQENQPETDTTVEQETTEQPAPVQDYVSEEPEVQAPDIEQTENGENAEQTEEQPPVDEYEGYYDSEGYYRYPNGTFYDPQGRYFDETGGYYDIDGNYHDPDEAKALLEQLEKEKQEADEEAKQAELDAEKAVEEKTEQEKPAETEEVQEPQAEQKEATPAVEQELFDKSEQPEVETKDNKTVVPTFVEENEEDEDEEAPVVVKKSKNKKQKQQKIVAVEEPETDEEEEDNYEDYDDYDDEDYDDYDGKDYEDEEPTRGPGRPRKAKRGRPTSAKAGRGPGRPAKKKGPGRPAGSTKQTTTGKVGRPKKEEVRGPGRPKKEEVRGPGRPKKEVKKGPGRPKKEEVRGPGRPKKEVKKGPGRPPKKKGPGRPKKK
mgnify:CR=1 FL=1